MEKEIQIGNRAKCRVSGFVGIAIARVEYLNGCVQMCLKPKVDKDGKEQEGLYVDIGQLDYVDAGIAVTKKKTGGPSKDAPSGNGYSTA